jgi:uracil-DNA glycosylase
VDAPGRAMSCADARREIATARAQAISCERCPLYLGARQTVFGEGPPNAALMLVGEQPSHKEDLLGRPFVGPAGALLDRALAAANIERRSIYLTNAVKHFKSGPRGKRRLHKSPNHAEIEACGWWLKRELDIVAPRLVVALGATAAYALMGHQLLVSQARGVLLHWRDGREGVVTVHPSAILRMPRDETRQLAFLRLVDDLRFAAELLVDKNGAPSVAAVLPRLQDDAPRAQRSR